MWATSFETKQSLEAGFLECVVIALRGDCPQSRSLEGLSGNRARRGHSAHPPPRVLFPGHAISGGGQSRDHLRIDSKGHGPADDTDAPSRSGLQLYHINETRGLLKKISSVLQKITDPIQPKVAEHRPQTSKRLSYPFSREKQHL